MKNQIVKKKYLIIAAVGIVLLALLFLLIVLFANSEDEYSFLEKNWINSNVNNVIDINVPSDIPVFNSSGKGVFIDFVNDFELDTNLSLNVVTTNANYSFNLKILLVIMIWYYIKIITYWFLPIKPVLLQLMI